ncbi:DUF1287 domain-containing protein [Pelagicoccus mobilis]|uniref:DUF1287 domain-containing protein n=1 Tax=Pelagicoccus mobilis TaxID=415221 RepID=A0A934RWB0_9BACT|nr:DUF1287 domain-containing protein [Pelagicoccus mobilis]
MPRVPLCYCFLFVYFAFVTTLYADNRDISSAARTQIGRTINYDPSYRSLAYPRGDVPIESGVCTDVVIRSLRDALNYDLQQLVHEDMRSNFSRYPQNWGLSRPDRNIDHRRVPNLRTFFLPPRLPDSGNTRSLRLFAGRSRHLYGRGQTPSHYGGQRQTYFKRNSTGHPQHRFRHPRRRSTLLVSNYGTL